MTILEIERVHPLYRDTILSGYTAMRRGGIDPDKFAPSELLRIGRIINSNRLRQRRAWRKHMSKSMRTRVGYRASALTISDEYGHAPTSIDLSASTAAIVAVVVSAATLVMIILLSALPGGK